MGETVKIVTLWTLVFMAVSFLDTALFGAPLELDKERTIYIRGVVGGNILAKAATLEKISRESGKPIYLVVDSPGGQVMAGLQFLNAMDVAKSRGVPLICFTPRMAASMAYHIVARCDVRYAFKYTLFMFHAIRVGGLYAMFTADEMEYLIKVLRAWELPLNSELIEVMGIGKDTFYYHYVHETNFTSTYLNTLAPNFITVIDDVRNIDQMFGEETK